MLDVVRFQGTSFARGGLPVQVYTVHNQVPIHQQPPRKTMPQELYSMGGGGWRSSTRNAFSRYRTPPWTSFVLLELVPQAKSSLSTSATLNPLDAASKAHPAPDAPPPII